MTAYHKIQTVYLRDGGNNYRTLLDGVYAKPEFDFLSNNRWTFTEKIDGTNIRILWDGKGVGFQGKTDKAQIPPFLLDSLEQMFPTELMLHVFGDRGGLTLYGEGYGRKIQKGHRYIPDGTSFILFDIHAGGCWFARHSVEDFAEQLQIKCVEIVAHGTLSDAVYMCREGFPSTISDTPAEGLVCRPLLELTNRLGERIITKIKCKDFTAPEESG